MPYDYSLEKLKLYWPESQKTLFKIRRRMDELITESGVARLQEILGDFTGDGWELMACVDYLCEMGEFVEVEQRRYPPGQYRIFRKPYED